MSKKRKQKPASELCPAGEKRVGQEPASVGSFAVMRHSASSAKRMHFTCWKPTIEAAKDEAQRLTAVVVAEHGPGETCFYVVQVVHRVGIIGGVLSS